MRLAISYSKRSCKTGRRLYELLKQRDEFLSVKRVRNDRSSSHVDVHIRWGNSTSNVPSDITLNSSDAVRNASNKKRMMSILRDTDGVNVAPCIIKGDSFTQQDIDDLRDSNGMLFVRGSNMAVRYDDSFGMNDLYCAKPINKDKEYRVHVFNGEIVAIYEKIPNDGEEAIIRKDANCKFSLRDHTLPNATCHRDAQEMCIKAVNSLGLLFGGVDLIRDKDTREFYITEINSSPALNTPNLDRYINKFIDYIFHIDEQVIEGVEEEPTREELIELLMNEYKQSLEEKDFEELKELFDGRINGIA